MEPERQRSQRRRARESAEEREIRRHGDRDRVRARRATETEQEREDRLRRERERRRERRAAETSEERLGYRETVKDGVNAEQQRPLRKER